MKTAKQQKRLQEKQLRRVQRVRGKVRGTTDRPRLSVYRSLKFCYAQIIDDDAGQTLVAGSDQSLNMKGTKTEKAYALGQKIGELALQKKITKVVFDRHGLLYHGRIKAVAEGARKAGLKF